MLRVLKEVYRDSRLQGIKNNVFFNRLLVFLCKKHYKVHRPQTIIFLFSKLSSFLILEVSKIR